MWNENAHETFYQGYNQQENMFKSRIIQYFYLLPYLSL